MSNGLGGMFDKFQANSRTWSIILFAVLAAMVVLNFGMRPPVVEYVYDAYAGFWPAFGLVVGLAMVIVMKKIVQPMIARREDYYDK
jgi:hypothetical protein